MKKNIKNLARTFGAIAVAVVVFAPVGAVASPAPVSDCQLVVTRVWASTTFTRACEQNCVSSCLGSVGGAGTPVSGLVSCKCPPSIGNDGGCCDLYVKLGTGNATVAVYGNCGTDCPGKSTDSCQKTLDYYLDGAITMEDTTGECRGGDAE